MRKICLGFHLIVSAVRMPCGSIMSKTLKSLQPQTSKQRRSQKTQPALRSDEQWWHKRSATALCFASHRQLGNIRWQHTPQTHANTMTQKQKRDVRHLETQPHLDQLQTQQHRDTSLTPALVPTHPFLSQLTWLISPADLSSFGSAWTRRSCKNTHRRTVRICYQGSDDQLQMSRKPRCQGVTVMYVAQKRGLRLFPLLILIGNVLPLISWHRTTGPTSSVRLHQFSSSGLIPIGQKCLNPGSNRIKETP